MATITITIPDDKLGDYLDGIAREKGPIAINPNTSQPFTKAQWARLMLKKHIVTTVFRQRDYLAKLAVTTPVDETGFDVN